MIREKTWTVSLFLTEGDGVTRAEAVLHSGADHELRGVGRAQRDPDDYEIPRSATRWPRLGPWRIWRAGCGARQRPTSRT